MLTLAGLATNLTNRRSRVLVCGTLSQPFQVTSGVPQGSVLGPFRFGLFINNLCSCINCCKLIVFADDHKIFRVINSPHDCCLLQSDISSVSDWCIANSMRLNSAKTRVVSYTGKTIFVVITVSFVVLSLHAPAILRT
jgi:hypothetical protein